MLWYRVVISVITVTLSLEMKLFSRYSFGQLSLL
ncbi:unnamed protein product [Acanthoscelides obtectus]|uniref:Uncharacterized protein n=1 Tax=Acanthoscelides obtectus TaxID=200917 RepID=A0A9P0KSP8_ACAOB|nr:unnamed protein product [Acanthoscelides obtectus]CAK1647487.1 hypothetical protein AOBTE_LOCUS15234 [Acanthoscelides obtectus]